MVMTGIKSMFSIDRRMLLLFRIAIGAIVFFDFLSCFGLIGDFYSPEGLMPADLVKNLKYSGPSIYFISDDLLWTYLLHGVGILLSILFMLGFKPRIISILLWALVVSNQNRIPLLTSSSDNLIAICLFLSIFLHSPESASEASAGAVSSGRRDDFSLVNGVVIIQMVFIYLVAGISKTGVAWQNGTAFEYALHDPDLVTAFGSWLVSRFHPPEALTVGIRYWEMIGWIFWFSPVHHVKLKTISIFLYILLHLGIVLTLNVGWFPIVNAILLLLILPSETLDFCGGTMRKIFRPGSGET